MAKGNTGTGGVLEQMVLPALHRGGYFVEAQADIGVRLGGGRHRIDFLARSEKHRVLISLKWQQVPGTAEQKVPFEILCLAEAVRSGAFDRAWLVLGGEGWKLRDFFTQGGLDAHLVHAKLVRIATFEGFVAAANRGEL